MIFKYFCLIFFCSLVFAANDPNCGTKGPNPFNAFSRIVNGEDANPHEFPWQCSLQLANMHICGSSIINKRWILTAGHCIISRPENFRVLCGAHNILKLQGTEVQANVSNITVHPKFWTNMDIAINDVALLKLAQDLDLDNPNLNLGSVCLPDEEPIEKITNAKCIATGWGSKMGTNPSSEPGTLQKVTISIWDQNKCKAAWISHKNTNITDGMICFGDDGKSTCNGDSGGPLNCFVNGRWHTYGVTSFGEDGCVTTRPSVDARVSHYSKWIWQTIERN